MKVDATGVAIIDMTVTNEPVNEEQSLVSAALGGDGAAFGRLVRPHLSVMYRVAHRASGDAALAEDAVQEALTIAHRKLHRYRPGTSLRSYLASIVVKRTHTLLRAEIRRKNREEKGYSPAEEATPEEHAHAADLSSRIRHVLAHMPKKRRMAAMLRLDAGMDYSEIADALGTSLGSTRVLVHLALKDLKDALSVSSDGGHHVE